MHTEWTDTMMARAASSFDGIGVHYYTVPGEWNNKGPAIGFGEDQWASTLVHTVQMDALIEAHAAVMDKYDPKKRVALLVDEWGTWYDKDPGTHDGFLRQQNSLRDALVTSLNFDIFAKHTDRLRGANIAQMVNVLQAMFFTDGARMVKTPTYHVFDLYKGYQDGVVYPARVDGPLYALNEWKLAKISSSAVRGTDGVLRVALTNVDPKSAEKVMIKLDGATGNSVTARIVTASTIDAHNTFDRPADVAPAAFAGTTIRGDKLTLTIPAKSVIMLEIH
jgi:alpha-N-arabinofuranosidase